MIFNGAIAQLEERLICIQEVVGSIPSGSTILRRGVHHGGKLVCTFLKPSALFSAPIAQLVEHIHGKDGVISSNLIGSSTTKL